MLGTSMKAGAEQIQAMNAQIQVNAVMSQLAVRLPACNRRFFARCTCRLDLSLAARLASLSTQSSSGVEVADAGAKLYITQKHCVAAVHTVSLQLLAKHA